MSAPVPFSPPPPPEVETASDDNAESEERRAQHQSRSSDSESSLRDKVMSGVGWSLLNTVASQMLGLVRTIILARLLLKEDFGLMAMVMTVVSAITMFTNLGLHNSLLSAKSDVVGNQEQLRNYLDTVWTIELARSTLVVLVVAALAPVGAWFYREPLLTPLILVVAFTPFLSALRNIGPILFQYELNYRRGVINQLINTVVTIVPTLILAWYFRNVWALVWGTLIGVALYIPFTYWLHPYRPRLFVARDLVPRLMRFSGSFVLIAVTIYIVGTLPNVALGRLWGPVVLGVYTFAYNVADLPLRVVKVMTSSLTPAIYQAARQDATSSVLSPVAGRLLEMGWALALVPCTMLMTAAPEFIEVVYGARWLDAVVPLQILLVATLFKVLSEMAAAQILSADRPQLESSSGIAEAVLFALFVFPLVSWLGAVGAALTASLVFVFSGTLRIVRLNQIAPGVLRLLPVLVAVTLLILGVIYGGSLWLRPFVDGSLVFRLIVWFLFSGVGTTILLILLRPNLVREAHRIVTSVRARLRSRRAS